MLNWATMLIMRITVNVTGPTVSTYGPGAFRLIMLALRVSIWIKEKGSCNPDETMTRFIAIVSLDKLTLDHGVENERD